MRHLTFCCSLISSTLNTFYMCYHLISLYCSPTDSQYYQQMDILAQFFVFFFPVTTFLQYHKCQCQMSNAKCQISNIKCQMSNCITIKVCKSGQCIDYILIISIFSFPRLQSHSEIIGFETSISSKGEVQPKALQGAERPDGIYTIYIYIYHIPSTIHIYIPYNIIWYTYTICIKE